MSTDGWNERLRAGGAWLVADGAAGAAADPTNTVQYSHRHIGFSYIDDLSVTMLPCFVMDLTPRATGYADASATASALSCVTLCLCDSVAMGLWLCGSFVW